MGTETKSMLETWPRVKGHIISVAQVNIHLFTVKSEYFCTNGLKSER